jgi:cyclic pyranopterin phosphate synthase
VLDGIAAAQRAGLAPVKVNMVLKRGVNDHEIIPMAEYFRNSGIILRFIEYMDVGCTNDWRIDDVVPARKQEQINSHYPIRQVDPNYTGEVAGAGIMRTAAAKSGDRVGHAGVCHERTCAAFHRRQVLHLFVRQRRHGFARASTIGDRPCADQLIAGHWGGATTVTRNCAMP